MESEVSSSTSREIAEAVLLDGEQRSRLVAYARSRFGIESDDAQDLLQETALELLRHRTIVRSPHGFTFKVFHTRCCRFLQARQANRRVFSGPQEPAETACDTSALRRRTRSSNCEKCWRRSPPPAAKFSWLTTSRGGAFGRRRRRCLSRIRASGTRSAVV